MKTVLDSKKSFIVLFIIVALSCFSFKGLTQTPVLGNYPSATVSYANGNISVAPLSAPSNVANAIAYTNSNFKGTLTVNPITGNVLVTNAHPAGSYTITIKAYNGAQSDTRSFTLTVNNPHCSQGLANSITNIMTGNKPVLVGVADFNDDGNQDIITSNKQSLAVFLGHGTGSFDSSKSFLLADLPKSFATGDFNSDGNQDVAVGLSGGPNRVAIIFGDGMGGFSGSTNVNVSSTPYAISVGDLNNDGKLDIISTNYFNNSVSVRLGNGTGDFNASTDISVGRRPISIAIGDFNTDGNLDFITANESSYDVSIKLGDGMGGFYSTDSFSVASQPKSVVIGDFNGDTKQDIAIVGGVTAVIRLGNGMGAFTGIYSRPVLPITRSLAVGDFNGDGRQDFVTSVYDGSIYLGDGTGSFTNPDIYTTPYGTGPQGIAIGDFNNDGYQDIVTANFDSSRTRIRWGGAGKIIVKSNNISIADGDITPSVSDHTDFGSLGNVTHFFTIQNIGTANLSINTISISGADSSMFNWSGINLPKVIPPGDSVNIPIQFISAKVGQLKAKVNIATDDCITANYDFAVQATGMMPTLGNYDSVAIQNASGNAVVLPSEIPVNATGISASTSTNFKGLLSVNPATGAITITNAHPAGTYTVNLKAYNGKVATTKSFLLKVNDPVCNNGNLITKPAIPTGIRPKYVVIADMNNDGNQDMIFGNHNSKTISIRLGDGNGSFSDWPDIMNINSPTGLAITDFNGDGYQDIAVANDSIGMVSVRLGTGTGSFIAVPDVKVGAQPETIVTGDFNEDGLPDMAVVNFNPLGTISIRLGDGLGGFSGTTNISAGNCPRGAVVGDFNMDGHQDLAVNVTTAHAVYIFSGDGLGGFIKTNTVSVGYNPWAIALGDFNKDGKQDFATANQLQSNISIRLGDGTGAFTSSSTASLGGIYIATSDLNGDGSTDFVTVSDKSDRVSFILDDENGFYVYNSIKMGTSGTSVAVGDFNNDGNQDIVVSNAYEDKLSLMINSGADTAVWLGVNPSWGDVGNWSSGYEPTRCTKVLVNSGVPYMPEVTKTNSICHSLTLNPGTSITIKPGAHLTIVKPAPQPTQ